MSWLFLSFLGMPTPETTTFIRNAGVESAFDSTFERLMPRQWIKVEISARPSVDGEGVDFVVKSTLNEGDALVQAFPLMLLSATAISATVSDGAGPAEDVLAAEFARFSRL